MTGQARIAALICFALLMASGCETQQDKAKRRLKQGKFTFNLPDLEGNSVSNTDKRFENKVVLYDIWGTWCPPCRKMTPFLKQLHADYASQGLVIVGIAMEYADDGGRDPKDLVVNYVEDNQMDYLILYAGAAEQPTELTFDILPFIEFDGFPTSVVIARDGTVKAIREDFNADIGKRIEAQVRELLDSN